MSRVAIISVDGHVKGSREAYRDYLSPRYRDEYDAWVRSVEDFADAGNLHPVLGEAAQWDSDRRIRDLESEGVVAEVLFPNGLPFHSPLGAPRRDPGAKLEREARAAHNRWLVDFCAATPGRRAGQAVIEFDEIDDAVRDVSWAKDHGLHGIAMPALEPGGIFFFDPVLDPVWAAHDSEWRSRRARPNCARVK